MACTLPFNVSDTALITLYAAKHGSNPSEVEAANRTLHIYDIAQRLKDHRLCGSYVRLASDVMNGVAFGLLHTPRPDQSFIPSMLSTIRSIERLFEIGLSQGRLRRRWRQKSDQRKIAEYQSILQQQLAIFGDTISSRGTPNLIQGATEGRQHPTLEVLAAPENSLREGQPSTTIDSGRQDSLSATYCEPSPDSHPSQSARATESVLPAGNTTRRPSHPNSPAVSPPNTLPIRQPLYPTMILGSQVTVFVIDQLIANFPSITENHGSGNVTSTTVTGSANDSSIRHR